MLATEPKLRYLNPAKSPIDKEKGPIGKEQSPIDKEKRPIGKRALMIRSLLTHPKEKSPIGKRALMVRSTWPPARHPCASSAPFRDLT